MGNWKGLLALLALCLQELRLLPDGGFCRLPAQVSHREAFTVEGGWLTAPDRMERLIRRYDATGAWQSATHQMFTRRAF